jgi:toluene monooxygenase system protein E
MMERLLVTYDFGESLLALNLVAMPAIDVALAQIKECAHEHDDALTGFLIEAQLADSTRRTRWTKRLMEFLVARQDNEDYAKEVIDRWAPIAERAVAEFAEAMRSGAGERARAAFRASLPHK